VGTLYARQLSSIPNADDAVRDSREAFLGLPDLYSRKVTKNT
jgi:hypothetical protein